MVVPFYRLPGLPALHATFYDPIVLFRYFYLDCLFMASLARGDIVDTGYIRQLGNHSYTVAHPTCSLA